MKKIIIGLMLLIIPTKVYANSGYILEEYMVKVTNPNGAEAYTYHNGWTKIENIPFNTEIRIWVEQIINGEIYGVSSYEDIYVKLDDTAISQDFEPGFVTVSSEGTLYSYQDVSIYKGPAEKYDKLDVIIPAGVTVKYTYSAGVGWYYITYNDVSGWVNVSNYRRENDKHHYELTGLAHVSKDNTKVFVIKNQITLYEKPIETSNQITLNIEPYTAIDEKYYNNGYYDEFNWLYVSFGSNSGWIEYSPEAFFEANEEEGQIIMLEDYNAELSNGKEKYIPAGTILKYDYKYYNYNYHNSGYLVYDKDYIFISNRIKVAIPTDEKYITVKDKTAIYEKPSEYSEQLGVILKNTKLEAQYIYDNYIYVKCNGKKGWIDTRLLAKEQKDKYQVIGDNVQVYSSPDLSLNEYSSISKDTIFISNYVYTTNNEKWLEISNNGVSGWIYLNDDIAFLETIETNSTTNKENENHEEEEKEETTIDEKNNEVNNTPNNISPNLFIAYCTIGVCSIAMIAIILLCIVNKKNQ